MRGQRGNCLLTRTHSNCVPIFYDLKLVWFCCLQEKQAVQHLKQQVVPLQERVAHYEGLLKNPEGLTDYSQDFFGKPTFLTVSGQLNAEMYATAMSDVYTFGEACPSCINLSTKLLLLSTPFLVVSTTLLCALL